MLFLFYGSIVICYIDHAEYVRITSTGLGWRRSLGVLHVAQYIKAKHTTGEVYALHYLQTTTSAHTRVYNNL